MIELAPHNPYGLSIHIPVLTAAGCFGYGVEYANSIDITRIGAIVTRSTSFYAQRQSQPRLIETPAGVLLTGTWPNPGLAYVLRHYAPIWASWSTPVIVSIVGVGADEYAAIAAELEGVEGVAGIELNVALHAAHAAQITSAVRAATQLPILVKLPPSPEAEQLAQKVARAGADALTLFAPFPAAAPDPDTGALVEGWLLGPATRPLVQPMLRTLAGQLSIPIIACGGIAQSSDAQQALVAGASAVQLGSVLLNTPQAVLQIASALADYHPEPRPK